MALEGVVVVYEVEILWYRRERGADTVWSMVHYRKRGFFCSARHLQNNRAVQNPAEWILRSLEGVVQFSWWWCCALILAVV